jgi:hypothetical protein
MEQQDKIRLLLSMQEHPEQYTDEQLHQMIADDPELAEQLEQLALTKQAFVKQEADEETIPVEEEWQKFYSEHADEIEALGEDNTHSATVKRLKSIVPYKVAASIIGILFTAGFAFATIHILSLIPNPSPKDDGSKYTQVADTARKVTTPLSTRRGTGGETPIVFDNVALEKMLSQIAAYYNKEVEFQNDNARQFRFYFVWKPDEGLDVTLHRLNLFESVSVELKSDKIVVE